MYMRIAGIIIGGIERVQHYHSGATHAVIVAVDIGAWWWWWQHGTIIVIVVVLVAWVVVACLGTY